MNPDTESKLASIPEPPDLKKYLRWLIIAFAINLALVVTFNFVFSSIIAAKLVFIEFAALVGLLGFSLLLLRLNLLEALSLLEDLAEQGRNEIVVQMRQGRYQLEQVRLKLENTIHPPESENAMADMIRHAMPLVQILVRKEKNWLQLGMFGWRLAQDAIKAMKQAKNN
jgi:hypothetical protein